MSRSPGGQALATLTNTGWQIPVPGGPFSWRGAKGHTSRIDHVVCSPALNMAVAGYLTKFEGRELVGRGKHCVSDHAPLVVDIPV